MVPLDFGNETSAQIEELGARMDSADSTPPTGAPREDLITKATSFLLNPKVNRDSELDQRAFLQRKGLTPVEIDMAFQRRMALMTAPAALASFMSSPKRSGSWPEFFHRLAMGVAVLGSASYALYWFFKTYVEPRLKAENRTEQIMTEILLELRKKSENDAACAAKTMVAIADLRDEMASLKKMLVARNQFPVPPSLTGVPVKIPSWQQKHQAVVPPSEEAKAARSRVVEVRMPEPCIEEVKAARPCVVEVKMPEPCIEELKRNKSAVSVSETILQRLAETEESAPDSGISPEATSSDGEPQMRDVKDKPRNTKKKRAGHS